jgi:uncharacterized DUF497 family protein
VKRYTWNLGKNTKLKEERGISFEEIQAAIERKDAKRARNKSRNHPNQYVFVVSLRGKTWLVPYDETESTIHFRTIMEV